MRFLCLLAVSAALLCAQPAPLDFLNHNRARSRRAQLLSVRWPVGRPHRARPQEPVSRRDRAGYRLGMRTRDGQRTSGGDAHAENDRRRADTAGSFFRTCPPDHRTGAQAERSSALAADRSALRFQVARSAFCFAPCGTSRRIQCLDHDGAADRRPALCSGLSIRSRFWSSPRTPIFRNKSSFARFPPGARLRVLAPPTRAIDRR